MKNIRNVNYIQSCFYTVIICKFISSLSKSRLRQIEQACADPNDNENEEESGPRRVQETDPDDEERICEQV